jgi:hypothetical protein
LSEQPPSYPPPPPTPPPPPGGYPPGGYGTPQYGAPQGPQSSGKSVAVMVLGIVGLVLVCGYGIGVIPSIVALALAPSAKREIRSSGGRLTGESFIKAGVICAWVAVGLTLLGIAIVVLVIALGTTVETSFETTSDSIQSSLVWLGR